MAKFELSNKGKKDFFTDKKTRSFNAFGNQTALAAPFEYRKVLGFIPISDTQEKIITGFRNSVSELTNIGHDLEKSNQEFYHASGQEVSGLQDSIPEVDDHYYGTTFLSETQQRVLGDAEGSEVFQGSIVSREHLDAKIAFIENQKQEWRKKNPGKSFQPYSYYENLTKQKLKDLEAQLQFETEYADSGSTVANMMGTLKGVHKDPLILAQYPASIAMGGNFKTWGNIAKMAFNEFVLATATEVGIQTQVVSYNKRLGSEYNWGDALKVIALTGIGAGVGVAGIGGVVKSTAKVYSNLFRSSKNARLQEIGKELDRNIRSGIMDLETLYDFINSSMSGLSSKDLGELLEVIPQANKGSTTNTVEQILKGESIINDNNPFPDTPSAQLEHIDRANKANQKLLNDHDDIIMDETIHEINPENANPSKFEVLDPDDIEVDAGTFQFKQDPTQDQFGVSKKLQGITKWNQDASNVVLVWERADGKKFIADGHQRLGLAKRIKAQKDGQKVELRASVYRETDGYNREDLFVKAAVVNVMNNTAEATDLAKVVRQYGSASTAYALEIAPSSSTWNVANNLAKLDPIAWQFFLNSKINDKVAAAVGKLIEDPDLHVNALEYLSKNKYANEVQLEQAINDLLNAGQTISKTEDLFGEQVVKEFLINERAAVLDKGIKSLKNDKSIAGYLVKNDEAIQKGGKNKLNNEYNKKLFDETAITLEKIIKLAKMKGELSDELSEAARIYKDGNKKEAIRYFKEAAKRSIGSDDYRGISTVGSERLSVSEGYQQPKPKDPPKSEAEKSLDEFENPHDGSSSLKIADEELEELITSADTVKDETFDFSGKLDKVLEEKGFVKKTTKREEVVKSLNNDSLENISKIPDEQLLEFADDLKKHPEIQALKKTSEAIEDTYQIANNAGRVDENNNFDATWIKERNWDGIINDLYGTGAAKKEKKMFIVMGLPASGKSTFANAIKEETGSIIIDSDFVKERLPEYDGGIGAQAVHVESKDIASIIQDKAMANGDNIILPIVGSSGNKVEQLQNIYKQFGYKLYLQYIEVPREIAIVRNVKRIVDDGRFVDPEIIDNSFTNVTNQYKIGKEKANGYQKITNIKETEILEEGGDISELFRSGRSIYGQDNSKLQKISRQSEQEILDQDLQQLQKLDENYEIEVLLDDGTTITKTTREMFDDIQDDRKIIDTLAKCPGIQ